MSSTDQHKFLIYAVDDSLSARYKVKISIFACTGTTPAQIKHYYVYLIQ